MSFALIYNKYTGDIESMVVPEKESESGIVFGLKKFWYQKIALFDISLFNVDVSKMQELLNKSLWQKSI